MICLSFAAFLFYQRSVSLTRFPSYYYTVKVDANQSVLINIHFHPDISIILFTSFFLSLRSPIELIYVAGGPYLLYLDSH